MPRTSLVPGDRAPAFRLTAGDGTTVQLADFRGQRVVLYFYPRDQTPGCTKEACDLQAARARFTRHKAMVLGMSCDSSASHARFAQKYGLAFPLLSDPDAKVCRAYGVYQRKSLYGRTFMGIVRTTFIIDQDGRIAHIFPKVRVDGHANEILKALSSAA